MRPDRRETALLDHLRRTIRAAPGGLISVHDYMATCVVRYYGGGSVLGCEGDFTTAPEVSQVFGELIGLWCAVVWRQMGSPSTFNLVELGPGRGTMMRDALRAMRIVPGCLEAARVQLIEPGHSLRAAQAATLATFRDDLGVHPSWPAGVANIAPAPTIVLGNEYIDALPVHQLVRHGGDWLTRCVKLGLDGHLEFAAGAVPVADGIFNSASQLSHRFSGQAVDGDVLELRELGGDLTALGGFVRHGLALLLIDYGHAPSSLGDTLQAVRRHRFEDPLCSPGEADLTAQVDFADLGHRLTGLGVKVETLATQAAYLSSLGITERASRLMAANPAEANAIEMAVGRLLSPSGMGARFKVLGARSPHLPPLPGFPT